MIDPVIYEESGLVFVMTEACNSNCIMCPMGVGTRVRGTRFDESVWNEAIQSIDVDMESIQHIDITGGEPFLEWERLIDLMSIINARWPYAKTQILTNGRALSIPEIQSAIHGVITPNYLFAIPLHASNAEQHDLISGAKGSFNETIRGLRFLSKQNAGVEIRIVGHKLNADDINGLCHMIIQLHIKNLHVNLIAMEMNGNAAKNREALWIDYDELYRRAEPGIRDLVINGIDVGLYNFPLCALPHHAWPLAKQSITDWKVSYYDACDMCSVKAACGGIFRSTYLLGICPVHPIMGV